MSIQLNPSIGIENEVKLESIDAISISQLYNNPTNHCQLRSIMLLLLGEISVFKSIEKPQKNSQKNKL